MSEKDQEKKKVVLKITVSNPKELSGNKEEPETITEWNYTRISIALIVLLGIFIAVVMSISQDDEIPVVSSSLPVKKEVSNTPPAHNPGKVVSAQLAKGVWENKPFGKINNTIKVSDSEATGVFYFTELENMQNQAVFHIWKYKGEIVFKKKKNVLKDHWNTYTSKLFTTRTIGPWSVETVDSDNRQLNVINFNVVAATD